MEYERIQKSQIGGGGGFSPGKLRAMLLGVEKKRKEEEEEEGSDSAYNLRSQASSFEGTTGGVDNCKDVDVVIVHPGCSTSASAESSGAEMMFSDRRLKDNALGNFRARNQEDPSLDYDSGHDAMSVSYSSIFEFQKSERGTQRLPIAPFSKPAPSKWDDAQKWIASPTWNRPKSGQAQMLGGQGVGSRKAVNVGYGSRQPTTKVVVEVPDPKVANFDEPDTKRIDTNHSNTEIGGQKFVSWEADQYPIADSYGKPVPLIKNSVGESAVNLSRLDSSGAFHGTTTFLPPPSTARSVSMRDMGTEMTPIASQEPSRTGTPVGATTPSRSPTNSRPSTPSRVARASFPTVDPNMELSEKEKTRREIVALGTQLGKMNIAAWASKEGDNKDASASAVKTVPAEELAKSVIETRAAAWEEAEKAKYLARFKCEEMKIQAWENHQKAKTEAEMRKVEVEIEKIRDRAHSKLMNKMAAARHKAQEKRAAAEAKRNQQEAKTEQQAEHIRKTGRIPSSSFSCWPRWNCSWCF